MTGAAAIWEAGSNICSGWKGIHKEGCARACAVKGEFAAEGGLASAADGLIGVSVVELLHFETMAFFCGTVWSGMAGGGNGGGGPMVEAASIDGP